MNSAFSVTNRDSPSAPDSPARLGRFSALVLLILPLLAHPKTDPSAPDLFGRPLEELLSIEVSTASKLPRSLHHSPGIVSVYSAEEIRLFGGRDFAEVLAKLIGVTPWSNPLTGKYRLIVRNDAPTINNNHVLILLDGVPINRESYAGGLWHQALLTAIPLDIIKQIEVIRGPGSVLYGTNAYAGVVNIITTQADEVTNQLRLSAGDNDARGAGVIVAGQKHDAAVVAAARLYRSEGNRLRANSLSNTIDDQIGEESPGVMVTTKAGHWHGNFWWGTADDELMRGSTQQLFPGRVRNEKYFANVGYATPVAEHWTAKADLSQVGGRTRLKDPIVPFGVIRYHSEDSRLELQLQGNASDNLSVVLGMTIDYLSVKIEPPHPFLPFWDNTLYGAYAQLEYLLGRSRLIAGAQYNKSESLPSHTIPRVGIIHDFTDALGAKLMYAEAFRAPYAVETEVTVVTPTITIAGNPNIEPELVATWDAQLYYNTSHLQSALTVFRTRQKDLIVRAPVAPGVISFVNIGELTIEGVELEGKYIPRSDWYLSASATWQRNEDGIGREDFTLNPDRMVKLGIGYQQPNWSVGVFDVYHSGYQDNRVVTPTRVVLNPNAESYHHLTLNASLTLPWRHHPVLSLYVDNVLDETVYLPSEPGFATSTINTTPALESGRSFLLSLVLPFR